MLLHYLKITFRNILKYKTQSIISIVGLSIGFLCFTLSNYYVQHHLSYNKRIPNSDRIYTMDSDMTESDLYKEFPEIEKIFPMIDAAAMIVNLTVSIDDKNVEYQAFIPNFMDASLIDFFSLQILHGTKEMISRTVNGVVLFESSAKKLSKSTVSLIGKELKTKDEKSYFITGILKDPPENSILNVIKDHHLLLGQKPESYKAHFSGLSKKYANVYYLRINKTVSKKVFQNKIELYFNKNKAENETESKYVLKSFTGMSNFGEYSKNTFKFLIIFGLLILLSTLFNFILFQFSIYYNRFNEYGMRMANGMDGRQFTLQLFVDIMVRFLISGFIVFFMLESFNQSFEKTYFEFTRIELFLPMLKAHLLKYILYGTILSLIFSFVLSQHLIKMSARSVSGYILRKSNRKIGRNILLLLQLVVMTVFIAAAIIVKLQVNSMRLEVFSNLTKQERDNIISFRCNYQQLRGQHDILKQQMLNSNQILDVTCSFTPVIFWEQRMSSMEISGIEKQTVTGYMVSLNFCDFFNGRIIQGNSFESATDYDAAIVNKNFQKLYPGESLTGKTFKYRFDGKTYRIVGVIDNIQLFFKNYNDGVLDINNYVENEVLFFCLIEPTWPYYTYYVKCKTGKMQEAKQYVETCLKEFVPDAKIEFKILQEEIDEAFSNEKFMVMS